MNLARGRRKTMGFSLPEAEEEGNYEDDYRQQSEEEEEEEEQGIASHRCQPENQVRPRLVLSRSPAVSLSLSQQIFLKAQSSVCRSIGPTRTSYLYCKAAMERGQRLPTTMVLLRRVASRSGAGFWRSTREVCSPPRSIVMAREVDAALNQSALGWRKLRSHRPSGNKQIQTQTYVIYIISSCHFFFS